MAVHMTKRLCCLWLLLLAATASVLHDIELHCCARLGSTFPGKVTVRSNKTAFATIQQSYWSFNAQDVSPACFIQPDSTNEVSAVVKFLTRDGNRNDTSCKFAVKSGGHTFWAGASSIQDGVTIDLAALNSVEVNPDRNLAQVGPGSRWGDVYSTLDKQGLTLLGGRMAPVGTGGLLTGGGLSYYQGSFGGFACDGIENHEVVLANGTIVNANRQQNADLHRALKGGGNNFGIVTRFDLYARTNTKIWGGMAPVINQRRAAFEWMSKSADSRSGNNSAMPAILQMGHNISMAILADADTSREPQVFREVQRLSVQLPSIRALIKAMVTAAGGGTSSTTTRSIVNTNLTEWLPLSFVMAWLDPFLPKTMTDALRSLMSGGLPSATTRSIVNTNPSEWIPLSFLMAWLSPFLPKIKTDGLRDSMDGSWILPSGPGLPKTIPSAPEGIDLLSGKMWGLTSHANFASMVGLSAAQGFRLKFFSWTVNNSHPNIVPYLEALDTLRLQEAQKLPMTSVTAGLYQPITARMRATGQAQGGANAMGLHDLLGHDTDLILVAIAVPYLMKRHDTQIEDWTQAMSVKGQNLAKEMGVYCSFSFLNYADKWQNPISTYSSEAQKFLLDVSKKYDPLQIWQKQVPGGFKLPPDSTA